MGNEALTITTEKAQNYGSDVQTITSMEVAKMVRKQHKNLLADIRIYLTELNELKNKTVDSRLNFQPSDFFREKTYSSRGKDYPCYDVTKKGCEFIAHKLTGIKGTEFTAMYINRFHDMEDKISKAKSIEQSSFILCLQGIKFVADDMKVSESSKLLMYNGAFEEFGFPTSFLPKYEDNGSREQRSATDLLNRNSCGMSATKFNQLLLENGYLEERERTSSKGMKKKFKALTDKGLEYGVNLINEKNQKEVQPYYYADTFMNLFDIVTN